MSIYVLCDVGLQPNIAHILYKDGINIEMIINDKTCLYNSLGKNSIKKIENVKNALKQYKNINYNESLYLLMEFGLSKKLIEQLKEKYIFLEDIENATTIEEFSNKYHVGLKSTEKIFNAFQQYKGKEYVIIKKDYSQKILEVIENLNTFSINYNEILNNEILKSLSINEEEIKFSLRILVQENNIIIDNDIITIKYKTLKEYINEIKKDEWKDIFVRNLEGETLADIGKYYNITRERTRQVFNKVLQSINKIAEEKYLLFYTKYSWTKECFCEVFEVEPIVFAFFEVKYKMGNRDILELLDKAFLNNVQKNIIRKHLKLLSYKGFIIQANRTKLIELLLKLENNQIHLNELISKYNNVISNDFKGYNFECINANNTRTIEGVLDRSNYVLTSYNRYYRYYDLESLTEEDILSLKELLNVQDGIYSSDIFFRNNKQLMKDIDIRDKYELHNLLKRVIDKDNVYFGRMPDIYIGYTDKTELLIDEVNLLSPISVDEFVDTICDKYGHDPKTMYAYIYKYIPEYITNNILNTRIEEFTDEEYNVLKSILHNSIYPIKYIKEIIKSKLNKDYTKYLNNLNFKRIGYKIREQYIYKEEIKSIDNYIRENILKNDIYTESQELKSAGSSYTWVLYDLLLKNRIFKIENEKYITETGLRNRQINMSEIKRFQEHMAEHYQEEPFNIYKIQRDIILDYYNFTRLGNVFIESILQYAPQLKMCRVEGNTIYSKSENNFTKFDFINGIIKKQQPITIKDINNYLINNYNFSMELYDIRYLIDKSKYRINVDTDMVEENKIE